MRASFLVNIADGDFGRGTKRIGASNIILIEDYKTVPNLDIQYFNEIDTGGLYRNRSIYRNTIITGIAQMSAGFFPVGYNAALQTGKVEYYIKTLVRKIDPVDGDPLGGGFHTLAAAFGSKKILYKDDGIYFEGSAIDGVFDPNITYEFLIEYTKKPTLGGTGLEP